MRNINEVMVAGRDYISNSSISTYRKCPHQFDLHYVKRITPIFEKFNFFIGKRIHETLDYYYGNRVTPKEAIAYFEASYDGELAGGMVQFSEGARSINTPEEGKEMGIACLTEYFGKYHKETAEDKAANDFDEFINLEDQKEQGVLEYDDFKVLATEQEFNIEMPLSDGTTIMLNGWIDMVAEAKDGRIFIVDHKVLGQKVDEDYLAIDNQISTYYLGAESLGYKPAGAFYNVIYKYKKPICQRYFVTRSERQLEDFRKSFDATVMAIKDGRVYKNISRECSQCDYRELCWKNKDDNYSYGVPIDLLLEEEAL